MEVRLKRSCRQCARAKRRCNGGVPCERCARQRLDCVYHRNPRDGTTVQVEPPVSASEAGLESLPLTLDSIAESDLLNLQVGVADEIITNLDFEEIFDIASLPAHSPTHQPRSPASTLKSFQTARLAYPIQIIKSAPASFVRENQTPWSHPLLWEDEMPKYLQGKQFICLTVPSIVFLRRISTLSTTLY